MRRSLPVLSDGPDALDLVQIPIPCEVPWDSMPGDEQVRHCGQCRQNVYNVSAYTRAEAMKLLRGRVCLRVYRRPDNTVITSDCRERLRAARQRGWLAFAGALLVVLWAQICAQFFGLWGLRRLVGPTTGEVAPIAAPVTGTPVPLPDPVVPQGPPRIEMGDYVGPVTGEPAPLPTPPPPKKLMGKIAHVKGGYVMGKK